MKMNTIIPNQMQFGLDVSDLPARAAQISSEALSLSGGGCRYVGLRWGTYSRGRRVQTKEISKAVARRACKNVCKGRSTSITSLNENRKKYYQCVCC